MTYPSKALAQSSNAVSEPDSDSIKSSLLVQRLNASPSGQKPIRMREKNDTEIRYLRQVVCAPTILS